MLEPSKEKACISRLRASFPRVCGSRAGRQKWRSSTKALREKLEIQAVYDHAGTRHKMVEAGIPLEEVDEPMPKKALS